MIRYGKKRVCAITQEVKKKARRSFAKKILKCQHNRWRHYPAVEDSSGNETTIIVRMKKLFHVISYYFDLRIQINIPQVHLRLCFIRKRRHFGEIWIVWNSCVFWVDYICIKFTTHIFDFKGNSLLKRIGVVLISPVPSISSLLWNWKRRHYWEIWIVWTSFVFYVQ